MSAIDRASSLGGRYRLDDVIGRGGMADVYRAVDERLGRPVAVKWLRDAVTDAREEARARNEAQLLAGLSHPGLVTLFDAGIEDGRPYLVMELVPGPSLAVRAPHDPADVGSLGVQVSGALQYVHTRGLVHRDLKPANLLAGGPADPWSQVKLADFGIARLLDSTRLTATGTTIGTAAYLAPEQVRGERVGPPADIWSLGLILLECLTGERAYAGPPAEAAVARLHRAPEVPLSLPAPWADLLTAMTSLDADRRPTAADVARCLGADPAGPGPGPGVQDPAIGAFPPGGGGLMAVSQRGLPSSDFDARADGRLLAADVAAPAVTEREAGLSWGPPAGSTPAASTPAASTPAASTPAASGPRTGPGAPTAVMPPRSPRSAGGWTRSVPAWGDLVHRSWFRPAAVAVAILFVAVVGLAIMGSGHSGSSPRPPSTATGVTTPAPLPAPAVPGQTGRDLASLHQAVNP